MSGAELRWPQSYGSVWTSVIESSTLESIHEDANLLAECPNYWVPKERILSESAEQPSTPPDCAIQRIYQRCMKSQLGNNFAGAEWWIQVYRPGQGLAFHFDKDEHLFKQDKRMLHPILSSILYLTGSKQPQRLGATVVVDQQFNNELQVAEPERPANSAIVWPEKNSFAAFDGRLGHGVLDSNSAERRVTMLINWWSHQPQAVRCAPQDLLTHRIKTSKNRTVGSSQELDQPSQERQHPSHTLQQNGLSSHEKHDPCSSRSEDGSDLGTTATAPARTQDDAAIDHAAELLEKSGITEGGGTGQSQVQNGAGVGGKESCEAAKQAPTVVIKIPPTKEPEAITVDDLLESYNLSCSGDRAVAVLAVEHEGFQLYPIGADQGDQFTSLETAAAFVSHAMLDSDSDSDGLEVDA